MSDNLDNTQLLLTSLFDRVSQVEPISFYVDILKDQIADSTALLNEVNSREVLLLDLLSKAQMLRNATPEQIGTTQGIFVLTCFLII